MPGEPQPVPEAGQGARGGVDTVEVEEAGVFFIQRAGAGNDHAPYRLDRQPQRGDELQGVGVRVRRGSRLRGGRGPGGEVDAQAACGVVLEQARRVDRERLAGKCEKSRSGEEGVELVGAESHGGKRFSANRAAVGVGLG